MPAHVRACLHIGSSVGGGWIIHGRCARVRVARGELGCPDMAGAGGRVCTGARWWWELAMWQVAWFLL